MEILLTTSSYLLLNLIQIFTSYPCHFNCNCTKKKTHIRIYEEVLLMAIVSFVIDVNVFHKNTTFFRNDIYIDRYFSSSMTKIVYFLSIALLVKA